jgi:hypothetical protein
MSKQKKYHYIYKTTCKITGKFYVGMHSTDNLEDGYLGSGKILGYSRAKYGDENHKKEIVEFCLSRTELRQREKEIVNEELLKDPLNINLKYGGEGGWDHIKNSEGYKEQQIKAGRNGGFANRSKMSVETQLKMSKVSSVTATKTLKTLWKEKQEIMLNINLKARIAANSEISKIKRKRTNSERKHQQGELNSQFGTCWVTNGIESKKIKKTELESFIVLGFKTGRIQSIKSKVGIKLAA